MFSSLPRCEPFSKQFVRRPSLHRLLLSESATSALELVLTSLPCSCTSPPPPTSHPVPHIPHHQLHLSDIPIRDLSTDFMLLAEERQREADVKEQFEKLTHELKVAEWLNMECEEGR